MEAIISAADMGFTGSLVGSSIPWKQSGVRGQGSEVRLHPGRADGAGGSDSPGWRRTWGR